MTLFASDYEYRMLNNLIFENFIYQKNLSLASLHYYIVELFRNGNSECPHSGNVEQLTSTIILHGIDGKYYKIRYILDNEK